MANVISMEKNPNPVNAGGRWAPLQNVALCARAVERALNRTERLPGIVVFSGYAGWGKSMAASFCANRFEGVYIECRSWFTKKAFAEAILREMDVRPARTIAGMMGQISEQLNLSQRPLIIDQCDDIAERDVIRLVQDIYEESYTTVLLIGEEGFPQKLQRYERIHSRVLVWQLAQPASEDDAHKLAQLYCPGVAIAPDLFGRVIEISRGSARRICVNLDLIRDHCQKHALKSIDLETWGRRELYRGETPVRRKP